MSKDQKFNNYYEKVQKDRSFEESPVFDGTRENWKPFGNYKEQTVEEMARKGRRL